MKKNDILIGTCVDYTYDGLGIVKCDNFTFFVRQVLKHEKIKFLVTKLKKTYGFGKCLEILETSSYRVEPFCPYFGKCGGCQLQHMAYEEQLRFKQDIVSNNLKKIAHLDKEVKEVVGASHVSAYRNKAQFPICIKEDKVEIGFYRIHSNDIIDMSTCMIQSNEVNEIMNHIKKSLKKWNCNDVFRHLLIKHAFSTKQMMVVFIAKEEKMEYLNDIVDDLVKHFSFIKSIILNVNTRNDNVILGDKEILLYGEEKIIDTLGDLSFYISSKSFYQVNPEQTKVLYQKALEATNITQEDTVIDLYCGVGTISLFLARKAKKVIGIEIIPQAIEDAKKNAKMNHIDNIEFVCSDAAKYATYLVENNQKADVVVVDPPRKGCDELTLQSIVKMQPKRIVYVSCNPATLARDIEILEGLGYHCEMVQPVDMFPESYHVEVVTVLHRVAK